MALTNNLSATFQGCFSKFFIDLINHLRIVIKIVLQELTMIASFNENDKMILHFYDMRVRTLNFCTSNVCTFGL